MANKKLDKATGAHLNLPGHNIADMEISIIEKVFNTNQQYRKTREEMFIEEFNSKYKGMNRKT